MLHDERTISVRVPNVQMNIENPMDETVLSQAPPEQFASPRLRSDNATDLTYWSVPPAPEEVRSQSMFLGDCYNH